MQLWGFTHFLPLGKGTVISLFGPPKEALPAWFREYEWGPAIRYATTNLFVTALDSEFIEKKMGDYTIKISSPERAIIEICYQVPNHISFEEGQLLMEGLTALRPDIVQSLLEHCNSVKAKRLFMYLADRNNHPWLKRLDLSKVNFGKGKRMIVKGGKFDSKYGISVPKSLVEDFK